MKFTGNIVRDVVETPAETGFRNFEPGPHGPELEFELNDNDRALLASGGRLRFAVANFSTLKDAVDRNDWSALDELGLRAVPA